MSADEIGARGLRLGLPPTVSCVPVCGDERALTYSVSEAVQLIGAPSQRWLVEQIRAGRFRARKIGRDWRLTAQDLADALEACSNLRGVGDRSEEAQ